MLYNMKRKKQRHKNHFTLAVIKKKLYLCGLKKET